MLKKINKIFYIRYKVPKDLIPIFYNKEILRSLRTEKKSNAIILHDVFISEIHKINLLARTGMISIDKLKKMALKFKTKKLNEITQEIDNHPNPKQTLMHQLDGYDDEKEKYKSCEINDDYSIVEDEAKELFDKSVIKKYDQEDLKNLSKELIDVHVQLIDFIEKKTKNSNVCQTPMSVQNTSQNTVKDNKIVLTIKDAFDQFIEYKDLVEKLSLASLRSYDSAYKYLLLFYKPDTNINSLKTIDFKDLQKEFMKLPKNALTNKSSTELMTNHSINKYFQIYKALFDYLEYEELTESNPVKVKVLAKLESTKVEFSQTDIENIFNSNIAQDVKDFIKVGLYTGLRIGELASITKNDITKSCDTYFITVVSGKTANAARQIPVHSKIKDIILKQLENNDANTLFFKNKNIATKKINKVLRTVITDTNKSFHSTRKNFTAKLYDNFAQYEVYIKVLVGHSTKNNLTFHTYAGQKLDDAMKIKMIESIDFHI